jgi:hypothetical protein
MHFDLRHRIHLHALLKDFLMKFFQVTSPNFNAIRERSVQTLEESLSITTDRRDLAIATHARKMH